MKWLTTLWMWTRSDPIRSSPRNGKLLRLRPGACFKVGETFAQVIARDVADGEDSAGEVEYTCRAAAAEFRLRLRATAAGLTAVTMTTSDGASHRLDAADVEAFA